jgi:hypothetical protein
MVTEHNTIIPEGFDGPPNGHVDCQSVADSGAHV